MSHSPYTPKLGCPPPFVAGKAGRLSMVSFTLEMLMKGRREVVNQSRLWMADPGDGATTILHLTSDYARSLGYAVGMATLLPKVDNLKRVVERTEKVRSALERPRVGRRRRRREFLSDKVHPWSVFSAPDEKLGFIIGDTARAALKAGLKGFVLLIDNLSEGTVEEVQIILSAARIAQDFSALDAPAMIEFAADAAWRETLNSLDIDFQFLDTVKVSRLSSIDSKEALEAPIRESPLSWSQRALEKAIRLSRGTPLMVQIIGDAAWRSAHLRESSEIDLDDVRKAEVRIRDQDRNWESVGHLFDDRYSL